MIDSLGHGPRETFCWGLRMTRVYVQGRERMLLGNEKKCILFFGRTTDSRVRCIFHCTQTNVPSHDLLPAFSPVVNKTKAARLRPRSSKSGNLAACILSRASPQPQDPPPSTATTTMSEAQFQKAVEIIQSLPKDGPIKPTQDDQLHVRTHHPRSAH